MKEKIKKIILMQKEGLLYDWFNHSNVVFSERVQTLCVDEHENIYINHQFILTMTEQQIIGVLYHELFHILYEHLKTKKSNHHLVNVAGDIFINEQLVDMGYALPDGVLFKHTYGVPEHIYTANDIYRWLEDNLSMAKKNELESMYSSIIDEKEKLSQTTVKSDEDKDIASVIKSKIKSNIEEKHNSNKKIQKDVDVSWDLNLTAEIGRLIKRTYEKNYKRPARYEPDGIIRPNHILKIKTPKINLYIDRSGSMIDDLPKVISAIKQTKSRLKNYVPNYYIFNEIITQINENELGDVEANGGTCFESVMGSADLHVIITDGQLNFDFIESQSNVITYIIDNNNIRRRK